MTDPVWDIVILHDIMRKLQGQVNDLQWELDVMRERMLREIHRLRRTLLLSVDDWSATNNNNNDDDDNNNNNKFMFFLLAYVFLFFYIGSTYPMYFIFI